MTNEKTFGEVVKDARKSMSLTREEFAEKCDMSTREIYNNEKDISDPKFSNVKKIFNVMGLDINKFYQTKE